VGDKRGEWKDLAKYCKLNKGLKVWMLEGLHGKVVAFQGLTKEWQANDKKTLVRGEDVSTGGAWKYPEEAA